MTFRRKIIAILIIVATIPVTISGLLATKVSQDELIFRVRQSHGKSAFLVADGVNRFLQEVERTLHLSTELIPFDEFPKEHLGDAVRIPYRQFDYLNALVLLNPVGNQVSEIVYDTSLDDTSTQSRRQVFTEAHFAAFARNVPLEQALSKGSGFGDVYYGEGQDDSRIVVAVSFPVENADRKWILAAEVALGHLRNRLATVASSRGIQAFIVDQKGKLVSHSHIDAPLATVSMEKHPLVQKRFEKNGTDVHHLIYEYKEGQKMTGVVAAVPRASLGVVVEQETKLAFRSAYQIRRYTIFWIVVGIVIAVFGGMILSRGISKPVMEMAKGVEAIERGDFTTRLNISSTDEIGQLGRSFNQMTVELSSLIEKHEILFVSSIHTLVASVEAKDVYTRGHSERVTGYTLAMVDGLTLSSREREMAELAGLLHDVGKIGIPEELLNKQGTMDDEEYDKIKHHPVLGEGIVSKIKHDQIEEVSALVRGHHEWWDGTGYPDGLRGERIPFLARILSIADAYDAMTSNRAYRKGMPEKEALDRLRQNAGTQFDPRLVELFCRLAEDGRLGAIKGKSKYLQHEN